MKAVWLWFLFVWLASFPCRAQNRISRDDQQWIQYLNQLKLNDRFALFSDVSIWRRDCFRFWVRTSFRTGLNYPLSGKLHGLSGLAFFQNYSEEKLNRIEFRPYQEFSYHQTLESTLFNHRLRIEGRSFRPVEEGKLQPPAPIIVRFRYRIFFSFPLWHLSGERSDRRFLLNLGDELMLNAGKEIVYNTLDNNRLLTGISYQHSERWNLSLMYNFQVSVPNRPDSFIHSQILWFSVLQRISRGSPDHHALHNQSASFPSGPVFSAPE